MKTHLTAVVSRGPNAVDVARSADEVEKALEEHALRKGDERSRQAVKHFLALLSMMREAGLAP